jgi:hypothetical protein
MQPHKTVAKAVRHPVQTTTDHPAETAPWIAVIIAALGAAGVALTDDQLKVLVVVVAALPGIVTWFVNWRRSRG